MFGLDLPNSILVVTAFTLQIALVIYFAARKWRWDTAMRYGVIVYWLGIPAALVSIVLLWMGQPWYTWLGGFVYAVWAIFGYRVDIARHVEWRDPILPRVFYPYVTLFIIAQVLYWWAVGIVIRPLWYAFAVLFVISTALNVTSHRRQRSA